ncbi:Epoxide hydrolase [Cordyceps fumosorosea ARSEF 2679]|uniref:Epoxide hydrolase n=1 Tax=Cordyceps fumosorosea (strain ARSEF 2679) TaxID=1081104 RepID=A0A162JU27_CORFA|nr:Epoxide hydrolase [Cordyceps fumosorosea ARSEF 2679]OAA73812.1 Epoxide hydrolase [Cordyceps fumosorosea ARSEF 2679]
MASDIKPYTVAVPEEALGRLKAKLDAHDLPQRVEFEDDTSYGASAVDIRRLAAYWHDGFDWRAQERRINRLPQYTTPIHVDGFGTLNIHFVHQKSAHPESIPLLFCHGWPGSFLEVEKLLPLLVEKRDGVSFHVVAPSLPNFAFSDGATKKGFGPHQYAETLQKLMQKLGYNKYVTQGGDWGYMITRRLGADYPESCVASHINLAFRGPPQFKETPWTWLQHALTPWSSDEKKGLVRSAWFREEGFGYNLLQSTKPATIGFALADSPVALLAWLYEKLRDWTDGYPWTDDEVLTWVSVYAFANAGPEASARIYYETRHSPGSAQVTAGYNGRVPLGVSQFPGDIAVVPRLWYHGLGPIVFEKRHKDGGHFAAFERPEELAEDLRTMFGRNGGASSVTKALSKL